MGKMTDATVFYCDKCREPIIGVGSILRDATLFQIANHVPEGYTTQEQSQVPLHSPKVGRIIIPEISYDIRCNPETGEIPTNDIRVSVSASTKYVCQECLDKIADEYGELCDKMNELWESKK